jgi:hypothetical protein
MFIENAPEFLLAVADIFWLNFAPSFDERAADD